MTIRTVRCLIFLAAFWTLGAVGAAAQDLRLVTAAADQDREAVLALLGERVDVNTARPDGVTALLWAAHWDDIELAERLLDAGADVNAADDHGVTALERAAENASVAMVETLLAAGADVDAAQTSGLTPLMTAARTGSVDVVREFIAGGADVNAAVTATGSTALMWAVSERHPEVVRLLLVAGADPRASTLKGFTPLMYAARNGDVATAAVLIAAGSDVNEPSADGTHVLPFSIVSGQDEFALYLLEQGADPNGKMGGVSALHAAAGNVSPWLLEWYRRHGRNRLYAGLGGARLGAARRLALVEALLERGADPNGRITAWAMIMNYIGYPRKGAFEPFACGTGDLRGATPLWVAAYDMNGARGQAHVFAVMPSATTTGVGVMRALLDAGADLHLTTSDGTTPLMAAAGLGPATYTPREPRGVRARSSERAVEFLHGAGADINATNEANFTALHGAAFRGMNEVIDYLVANGADIDARDFRGRTAYRMAEGSKQSFQFQSWPETAALPRAAWGQHRVGDSRDGPGTAAGHPGRRRRTTSRDGARNSGDAATAAARDHRRSTCVRARGRRAFPGAVGLRTAPVPFHHGTVTAAHTVDGVRLPLGDAPDPVHRNGDGSLAVAGILFEEGPATVRVAPVSAHLPPEPAASVVAPGSLDPRRSFPRAAGRGGTGGRSPPRTARRTSPG